MSFLDDEKYSMSAVTEEINGHKELIIDTAVIDKFQLIILAISLVDSGADVIYAYYLLEYAITLFDYQQDERFDYFHKTALAYVEMINAKRVAEEKLEKIRNERETNNTETSYC